MDTNTEEKQEKKYVMDPISDTILGIGFIVFYAVIILSLLSIPFLIIYRLFIK